MARLVNQTSSGRQTKKPKEIYFQNCVLKATLMQNARDKKRPAERVKKCRERKKERERAVEEEMKKKEATRKRKERQEEKKKDEKKKDDDNKK